MGSEVKELSGARAEEVIGCAQPISCETGAGGDFVSFRSTKHLVHRVLTTLNSVHRPRPVEDLP